MAVVDEYFKMSESEWKDILEKHNCPYYPRWQNANAELTFYNIRAYFYDKLEKPKFCNISARTKKLEAKLIAKYHQLNTIVNLDKIEALKLKADIASLERKLKIRID